MMKTFSSEQNKSPQLLQLLLKRSTSEHEFEDNEAILQENYHDLDWEMQSLCHEVLNEEFFSIINEFLDTGKKIEVDMIEIRSLSDIFIEETFNLNIFQQYFDVSAWKLVSEAINTKIKESTFPVCFNLGLNDCIQCNFCDTWYHFNCAGKKRH